MEDFESDQLECRNLEGVSRHQAGCSQGLPNGASAAQRRRQDQYPVRLIASFGQPVAGPGQQCMRLARHGTTQNQQRAAWMGNGVTLA